jgi:hypothetical protein
MTKKQFFAIIDTETTVDSTVADFACIIVDRKGTIHKQCAVLVKDQFDTKSLFYIPGTKGDWSESYAEQKRIQYLAMLDSGQRIMASNQAINRWLDKAVAEFNPTLTAYNLAFDADKCQNTNIDLSQFQNRFCLWNAASSLICNTKRFRQFCIDKHAFNAPTKHGNMSYKTNAEIVCGFLRGEYIAEPHTALEDARDFELPILLNVIRHKKWQSKIMQYNWRNVQVRDNFKAV